jgi:anti-anti-sigma factor
MQLTTEQLPSGVEKIALVGRMDIAGTEEIDDRFTLLTKERSALIVVELSQVSFLASIGIRALVSSAKSLARNGGRMVLANPQPLVGAVLKLACIDTFIPVYADVEAACAGLKPAMGGN